VHLLGVKLALELSDARQRRLCCVLRLLIFLFGLRPCLPVHTTEGRSLGHRERKLCSMSAWSSTCNRCCGEARKELLRVMLSRLCWTGGLALVLVLRGFVASATRPLLCDVQDISHQ